MAMYIYVLDGDWHLLGVLGMNELLHADPKNKLEDIMTRKAISVSPSTMRLKVEPPSLTSNYRGKIRLRG